MILFFDGMFKLVHLRMTAFRNVRTIGFDGTDRAYLRKVLQQTIQTAANHRCLSLISSNTMINQSPLCFTALNK